MVGIKSIIKSLSKRAGTFLILWLVLNVSFGLYCTPYHRSLQLQLFSVPFILLCALPFRRNIRIGFAFLSIFSNLILLAYFGIRGYLGTYYDADLESTFILESLANTSSSEAFEYIWTVLPQVLCWSALTGLVFFVQTVLTYRICSMRPLGSKIYYGFVVLLCCLAAFGWCKDAWREEFPVSQFAKVFPNVREIHEYWESAAIRNKNLLVLSRKLINSVSEQPKTIVLVIGESTTSESMSLYGYQRNTTPLLLEAYRSKELLKAGEAFSVRADTIAAFETMFKFEVPNVDQPLNVLAFFKEVGYDIFWISNQDDLAIKSEYQSFANHDVSLNRQKGRSAQSMDEKVLPELDKALRNPSKKKLIVVHLMGIHPHFSLRYPGELQPNWQEVGPVEKELEEEGRSLRTKLLKQHYDMAMLYQDSVLHRSLELTKDIAQSGSVSWLYLSDHGSETGERSNFLGHSPKTLGGYAIPFLFWTDNKNFQLSQSDSNLRAFRGDWLSYLLLDLAEIGCRFPIGEKSWANENYRWIEPAFITDLKENDSEYEQIADFHGHQTGS